jgi:hypothetical protein
MTPASPSIAQSATSEVVHAVVLVAFTTGMNTLASIMTPSVMLIIPETNGLAMIKTPHSQIIRQTLFKYNMFVFLLLSDKNSFSYTNQKVYK